MQRANYDFTHQLLSNLNLGVQSNIPENALRISNFTHIKLVIRNLAQVILDNIMILPKNAWARF